ncbi:pilus assembly PilX family protein [Vreelandella subglaciescola]|uniref:PilX N-terminal n=1 Tax=Vreelandella subglaciescola TaxID=29571 RepID=A0A1M7GHH4_9GAMM|nr:pilus assembly PilX N-terminal domain-containing protein [Halomonas subglaciescola]SHM15844.1 PilX N-terminal [Halomonas subglaciescola]
MGQAMKQQRGAALVIVLALLTGALVVGISGMQSSLIDERLAGNYRASAQAQMNAEIAAASVLDRRSIKKDRFNDAGKKVTLSILQAMDWDELDKNYSANLKKLNYGCERNGQPECVYISLILSEGGHYVVTKGVAGGRERGRAESTTILLKYDDPSDDVVTPFGSAVTSCQNITLSGSATITGGVVAGNDVIVSGNPAPPDSLAAGGEFVFPDWWGNQNQEAIKDYQDSEDGYKFVEKCDGIGVLEKGDKDQSYFDAKASELDVAGAAEWLQKRGLDHYYKQTGKTFVSVRPSRLANDRRFPVVR